ncbi:MAG: cytochrome c [Gammaproteobacteria bacterium]|nr:cytochrome c [Gammaproteobacteria bacterium]
MHARSKRAISVALLLATPLAASGDVQPETFAIGRPATAADIAPWDIDVGPDGTGLPDGVGSAKLGESVYAAKCASCHGADGRQGRDRLAGNGKYQTVGNHWPYATTLFDYIRRAMPSPEPGSLSDAEVYSLTAYVLYLNDLVSFDQELNASSLPQIEMPAHDRFVTDDRRGGPEVR